MSITFTPAVRDRLSLLITLSGGTGSGKSLSGLKIARGLAAKPGEDLSNPDVLIDVDKRIAAIDTESGRLKHYAPAPGERLGFDKFGFMHADMKPPFSPDRYTEAITAADAAGFEVILVDSGSHEWAGEGGVSEMQEEALDAAVQRAMKAHESEGRNYPFDVDKTRERLSLGCWKDAKVQHKKFVSRLLQCRAHIVFCQRAEEKLRMETVKEEGRNGRVYTKTVITQPKDLPVAERWVPICEKRLPFEFTVSLLLTAAQPGVPIPIKLEEQHRKAVPLDRPISEETGRLLAAWARGGPIGNQAQLPAPPADLPAGWNDWSLEERGANRASLGMAALQAWFTTLTVAEKKALKPKLDADWKPAAEARDKEGMAANETPLP